MTTDLHSAVRTAVDEARRLATEATPGPWEARPYVYGRPEDGWGEPTNYEVHSASAEVVRHQPHEGGGADKADATFIAAWSPSRALAMCDWADDVLYRHVGYVIPNGYPCAGTPNCRLCNGYHFPCNEVLSVAAAFGVDHA